MKRKYTRPVILDIHNHGRALGECVGGESASHPDWCSGGANVDPPSYEYGGCNVGGNASVDCTGGTRPSDAYCTTGDFPLA